MSKNENQDLALLENFPISEDKKIRILDIFLPNLKAIRDLKEGALALVVTDEEDKEGMKKARELRLQVRKVRTDSKKLKESEKSEYLQMGNAIQGIYNVTEEEAKEIEDHLLKQEKFAEEQQKKREEEYRTERGEAVEPYKEFIPMGLDLGTMEEEEYVKLFKMAKLAFENQEREREEQRKQQEHRDNMYRLNVDREKLLRPYWNLIEETDFEEFHWANKTEEDFNAYLESLKQKQRVIDEEKEELRKENERIKKEAEKKAERMKLLSPYIEQIDDIDEVLALEDIDFDTKLDVLKAEKVRLEEEQKAKEQEQEQKRIKEEKEKYMRMVEDANNISNEIISQSPGLSFSFDEMLKAYSFYFNGDLITVKPISNLFGEQTTRLIRQEINEFVQKRIAPKAAPQEPKQTELFDDVSTEENTPIVCDTDVERVDYMKQQVSDFVIPEFETEEGKKIEKWCRDSFNTIFRTLEQKKSTLN